MYKRALILGVGGQDGSYLAEHLLSLGYEVHGLVRHSSVDNLWRIKHLLTKEEHKQDCGTRYRGCAPDCLFDRNGRLTIHHGDLLDQFSLERVIAESGPHELYNEADQDHVGYSTQAPLYSSEVTNHGVLRLFETVRRVDDSIRVFQPLSMTIYGSPIEPVDEKTLFCPNSPYAIAKVTAFYWCQYYRNRGLHISTAIMGNHDSERRGEDYLLQKIARGVVNIARRKQNKLRLWNLSGKVDIGHSREFMEAAYKILQLEKPDDFCLASGKTCSVLSLASEAFNVAGLKFETEVEETKQERPSSPLTSYCEKASKAIGWSPEYNAFDMSRLLTKYWMKQK